MQFVETDLFRHQIKKVLPKVGNNIWIEVIKRQILEIWKTNPINCFNRSKISE